MTKTALITGSTSGIGKSFAELMANKHYNLVLVSRNAEKLAKQAEKLSSIYPSKIITIPMDLSRHEAARKIHETVYRQGIRIHILINNAGFNEYGSFLQTDLQKELDMLQVHAACTTEMMKLFIPDMIACHFGRILNLGSTGSYIACPNDAVYAATKSYILSLSTALKTELRKTGVSITTLCPGSTRTEFAVKAGMENAPLFSKFVMKPEKVAQVGYAAMMKQKDAVVVGRYNRFLVWLAKILPNSIIGPMTQKMLQST